MSLEDRVVALELANRRLKLLFGIGLMCGVLGISAAAADKTKDPEALRARRFEAVDPQGNVVAIFGDVTFDGAAATGLMLGKGDRATGLFTGKDMAALRVAHPETANSFGAGVGRDGEATAYIREGRSFAWQAPQ